MDTSERKLSIITNFKNCTMNCPYCVWKKSGNADIYTDFEWTEKYVKNRHFKNVLFTHLKSFRTLNDVYSISGGSDPLVDLELPASKHFYKLLHKANKKFKMKYQIHTAFKDTLFKLPSEMYDNLDKVVLHIMENDSIEDTCILKYFLSNKGIKMRVAIVVTPTLKKNFCEELEKMFAANNLPLSYREMWPYYKHPEDEWFRATKERNPINKFISQKDYNLYIMPDLNLTSHFIQGV